MPFWTNSEDTMAIWFQEGRWSIGPKSNLGTDTCSLKSVSAAPCPESELLQWMYNEGEEWINADNDAKVLLKEGEKFNHKVLHSFSLIRAS